MRLLAVTAVAPWPVRGGFSLRAARLLEELATDWDLTVIQVTPEGDRSGAPTMSAAVAELGSEASVGWPFVGSDRHHLVRVRSPVVLSPVPPVGAGAAKAMVTRAALTAIDRDSPQAALLWPGTEFLLFDRRWSVPTIADRVDAATAERLRALRRAPLSVGRVLRNAWYERAVVRAASTVAATDADARWLARLGGRSVASVPNGVATAESARFEAESPRPTVVFTGTLDYPPNIDAARVLVRRIWPAVKARVPAARLVIAGRRPGPKVLMLGRAAGVEVRADVAAMDQVLLEGWLAVAPMRLGTGVKNKVLEAWAVGRPVVMTTLAANGLAAAPALAHLVVDRWSAMAERVAALLEDADHRHTLGNAALAVAGTSHRWSVSAAAISRLLRTAAGEPG